MNNALPSKANAEVRAPQRLRRSDWRTFALAALGIVFGIVLVAAAEVPRKKFIEVGWDIPDTAFLRQHWQEMERTAPFDGVNFYVAAKKPAHWTQTWVGQGKIKSYRDTNTYHSAPASLALEAVDGGGKPGAGLVIALAPDTFIMAGVWDHPADGFTEKPE